MGEEALGESVSRGPLHNTMSPPLKWTFPRKGPSRSPVMKKITNQVVLINEDCKSFSGIIIGVGQIFVDQVRKAYLEYAVSL